MKNTCLRIKFHYYGNWCGTITCKFDKITTTCFMLQNMPSMFLNIWFAERYWCDFFFLAYSTRRGWFYHKELRMWFSRFPNLEPLVKAPTYERGCYLTFDPITWETKRKVCSFYLNLVSLPIMNSINVCLHLQDNFVLQYDLIEKKPTLHQH